MLLEVMNQSKADEYTQEYVWRMKEVKEVTVKIDMFLLLLQYYRQKISISDTLVRRGSFSSKFSTYWVSYTKSWRKRLSETSNCVQKRRCTAETQFSVWAMIEIDYKSELMFYAHTEEKNHEQKNEKIRKKKYKMSESMTQKRYANEILSIVEGRITVERKRWSKQLKVSFCFRRIMTTHTIRDQTRISLDSGRFRWSWNSLKIDPQLTWFKPYRKRLAYTEITSQTSQMHDFEAATKGHKTGVEEDHFAGGQWVYFG